MMAAGEQWLQDVARTQLHKFLVGMAPIKRIAKVVTAVSALLQGSNSSNGQSNAAAMASAGSSGLLLQPSAVNPRGGQRGTVGGGSAIKGSPPRMTSVFTPAGGGRAVAGMGPGSSPAQLAVGVGRAVQRTVVYAGRSKMLAQVIGVSSGYLPAHHVLCWRYIAVRWRYSAPYTLWAHLREDVI